MHDSLNILFHPTADMNTLSFLDWAEIDATALAGTWGSEPRAWLSPDVNDLHIVVQAAADGRRWTGHFQIPWDAFTEDELVEATTEGILDAVEDDEYLSEEPDVDCAWDQYDDGLGVHTGLLVAGQFRRTRGGDLRFADND